MPGKNIYASIFLVSLSLLMYEILLTRIFSVTMYYHFAFLIVSVAMFGITAGCLAVFLFPDFFTRRGALYSLSLGSLLQALGIIAGFAVQQNVEPFFTTKDLTVWWLISAFIVCAVIAVPFAFGGAVISLAIQKFSGDAGRIYAFDLIGAACGCIAFIFVIEVAGGPTSVIISAFFAAAASHTFGGFESNRNLKRASLACAVLILAFAAANFNWNFFTLHLVKGEFEEKVIFEKWNSFSRITVSGDPTEEKIPFGWQFSDAYPRGKKRVKQLMLYIDALAGTPLTNFNGDTGEVEFLKHDIINFAHYLKTGASILVIGSGGGRDVLSALAFGSKSITAVEINGDIIKAVNEVFGDFTGRLDKINGVSFINDEARSFAARNPDRYDIIQVSLVDTWAATASGAFVLSENSLYTKEAWALFLQRLTKDGMITFSRWYYPENPGEIYRLASLAAGSLAAAGIKNPRGHVYMLKKNRTGGGDGIGTIIVKKEPFSAAEIDEAEGRAGELGFDILAGPRSCADENLGRILAETGREEFIAAFPIDISAPDDDRPFFFNMLKFSDIFNSRLEEQGFTGTANMKAIKVVAVLLFIVFTLTILCVITPLALRSRVRPGRSALPFLFYFSSIGAGFMLIEISLMQKLNTFLGHPVYGLLVVLFTILIAGGCGSYISAALQLEGKGAIKKILLAVIIVLSLIGVSTPLITASLCASNNHIRVAAAALMVFIPGIFMGMPFPVGLKFSAARHSALIPWFFGVNGAFSVLFSVAAVAISLAFGITSAFALGCAFYITALIAAGYFDNNNNDSGDLQ
jgi:MFS family permease